jgi:regulator of protease activity HflC (stomatin/prohibitin superfamily)
MSPREPGNAVTSNIAFRALQNGGNARKLIIGAMAAFLLLVFWPFRSVPTGSRGAVTQFGAIKGI